MFKRLQSKTKKAIAKVGAVLEAIAEGIGDLVDGIEDLDFD